MEEVKKIMEQLQKTAKAFSQSKHELLNNIRTRLSGWILQVRLNRFLRAGSVTKNTCHCVMRKLLCRRILRCCRFWKASLGECVVESQFLVLNDEMQ